MVAATSDRKGTEGVNPWFGCRVKSNLGNVPHQIQYFPTLDKHAPAGRYATVAASGLIVSGGLVELVCRSFDVGFKVQIATYTAVAGAGLVIL
jgi:hypothetical protein